MEVLLYFLKIQGLLPGLALKHDHDAHPPILEIQGVLRVAQLPVGAAPHGNHLARFDAAILHETAGGIGPVGGQFPVGVVLGPVGAAVGVPLDADTVGDFSQLPGDDLKDLLGLGLEVGAAEIEEMGVFLVKEFDAQTLVGDLQGHLVFEAAQRRHLGNDFGNALFNLLQGTDLAGQVRGDGRRGLQFLAVAGGGHLPAYVAGFHEPRGPGQEARVLEILGDVLADGLTLAHDPEHNEQGHHGRDKIGVGHLPGPAVGPAALHLLFLDYPRFCRFRMGAGHISSFIGSIDSGLQPQGSSEPAPRNFSAGILPYAGQAFTLMARQASSTSAKLGRKSLTMTRRANSTATMGGMPLA